jgi:NADPH:quinone reductase-like Zn-dependent oxidoreductase
MKAIEIEKYGSPDVLELHEVSRPPLPGSGEVLIRVKAAAYNPVDSELRKGIFDPVHARSFPQRQGNDWAGVVEAAGTGVPWNVGDELIGCQPAAKFDADGTWAELMVAKIEHLAKKPASLSWEEAAGLPLVGLTALQALRDKGDLKPGKGMNVMINGASGGVGHVAVQIARALGASRVVGTAGPKNLDFVRQLGADEVIDYHDFDPHRYQGTFHIFFDAAAKLTFNDVSPCLTDTGVYIRTRPTGQVAAEVVGTKIAGAVGYDKRAKVIMMSPNTEDLNFLKQLVDQEKLKVSVGRTYSLDNYRRFVREAEESEEPGKYVVRIG